MSWKEKWSPSRIAAGLVALCGLGTAIAVPLADMDWEDTTSVLGGLGAITIIVYKWLDGRSKWEVEVEAPIGGDTGLEDGMDEDEEMAIPEGDEGDAASGVGPDGQPIEVTPPDYPEAGQQAVK